MESDNFYEKMDSFLQSSEWEETQKKFERRTWRINNVLVIEHILPGGFSYLYAPRYNLTSNTVDSFFEKTKTLARERKSLFLKLEPLHEITFSASGVFSESIQPCETEIVALDGDDESILSRMHQKTRYNIRLAEKKGVTVSEVEATHEAIEEFWNLLGLTAERDVFSLHEKNYYHTLFSQKSDEYENKLYSAMYEGKILAMAIINEYRPSGTVTYIHGASSNYFRNLMAPYLLHWEIIRNSREKGFLYYDLGGTDEIKWPGVTRFKRGFGGEKKLFPVAIDCPYRPFWYKIYRMVKGMRKSHGK